MDIKFSAKYKDSKLSLYWNNDLIYTGIDDHSGIPITALEGWNSLVVECERLSPYKNFGELTIESFLINDTDTWPVKMTEGDILIPFSLLHGLCQTEDNNTYLAFDNKLFTNSCQKIFFKFENSKIVDYYHFRDSRYNDIIFKGSNLGRYLFQYSEIYQKLIHRHMMTDHFMMVIDLEDQSTYGSKWSGVKFEFTESALAEDLQRTKNSPLFPFGATLTIDNKNLGFNYWLITHVFGSYLYKPIPPEIVAPLLKRV
jgi:hypothetical protein